MKTDRKTSAASVPHLLSFNRAQCAVVLGCLYYQGNMSYREICDELGWSKSSVSHALEVLISGEIVRPTEDVPENYGIGEKTTLKEALELLDSLSGGENSGGPKQKLTLAIRKDVIERAKARGINISAITEELLKAVTYDYIRRPHRRFVQAYQALFEAIMPVVEKYKLVVEVGQSSVTNQSGKVKIERSFLSYEVKLPNLRTDTGRGICEFGPLVFHLYSPRVVLENLIEAVIRTGQKDNLRLQELEIGLRLAKAILSDDD